jgi:insertion element IS1 protein InsB
VNILEIESIKLRQAEMPAVVICKVDREDRKSSEKTNKINELDNGKSEKKSVEVDEMWSFVESKKQQRWLWHAIDHMTGKVLAYVFGDRSDDCFIRLQQLLIPFGISTFHTDDWGAYNRWLLPEQHVVSKKHTQTIERKHLTLRTRLKRLARKTICYSKCKRMHDIVVGLFINIEEFGLQI